MLCSCHRNRVWQTLDVAESIMDDRPDSALALLSAVDGNALRGETQARHALLLSQAYDKNYIDVTDDSLISIAVDYYDLQDNGKYKMLAYFYKAVIYYNRNELQTALKYALPAEKISTALGDPEDIARVHSMLSYIYDATFNLQKSLEYAESDLHNAKLTNKPIWVQQAYRSLTLSLVNTGNYNQALTYIDTLRLYAQTDESMIADLQMVSYAGLSDYPAIDSIYRNAQDNGYKLSAASIAYAARAAHELGQYRRSADLLALASQSADTDRDLISVITVERDMAIFENNYHDALKYQLSIASKTDSILLSLANNSIHLVQIDFEKYQNRLSAINHNVEKHRLAITISILACVVIILILSIIIYRLRLQRKIQQAEYKFLLLQSERNKLNTEINTLKNDLSKSKQQTKLAFINKFAWIEDRGMLYLDVCHQNKAAEAAYKKLESTLNKVRSAAFKKELEDIINLNRDNLITRLREECPKLTQSELTLLLYMCAGLSLKVITCILNKQGNALYNQKHRIRNKLEEYYPEMLSEMRDIFA